ncbi:restriction endonuclease [Pedobacter sp. GR22-10]|uniref:restriction endonuclease n=1 Tax=Pedobacter sp. GR22-10 TaxID=2994472 RepID=UPI00224686D0|nr:restriction endonuclease [Pedobacter sp. GR22-10]MCX2429623.1 restriction endonuclease [Pedobacter sp. GR22-10]
MIDFKEIASGENWELFTRDFFQQEGFFIESTPDRGPDGGKDILLSEIIKGKIGQYKFTWLVSCKHKATSKRAVNEIDEQNILERVASFKADGFIGMYSTVPSSGLGNRLKQLKENGLLKDFRVYDHKSIENILLGVGYSKLMLRYLPKSYQQVKPLHSIFLDYEPLECAGCGKDLLIAMTKENLYANVILVTKGSPRHIVDVYAACTACDTLLQKKYLANEMDPFSWYSLNDLMNPAIFIQYFTTMVNQIRSGSHTYEDEAFDKEKVIFLKMAQKVMREMTELDRKRHNLLSIYKLI